MASYLDAYRKPTGVIDYAKLASRMADENSARRIEIYLRAIFKSGYAAEKKRRPR